MPISFEKSKEGQANPLFPFGPMMFYGKMPMDMVRRLNKYVNKTIKDKKKASLLDHSDHLVGKVEQEFLIEEKELQKHLDFFNNIVTRFIGTDLDRNFRTMKEDTAINIKYKSAWIVRQFAGEYNPAHIHTQCDLSCVGYLRLPEKIEEEWEEDYKDHHPANGHIQFAHGTPSGYSNTNFMVKPQVGDFYIFPAELFHCVYPFKTKGERRSFSVNFSFIEVPKEKQSKQLP